MKKLLLTSSLFLFTLNLHASQPDITAESALIMEAESGRILWGKNIDTKRYPASTTKILTALLLLENTQPNDYLQAPSDIEKVNGSSMNLKPLERVKAKDMLYALLLRSANDGAHTIALHISGSISEFGDLMDKRASQAGAKNSQFFNPHGLNHDRHMTTARDLALITREALRYPEFAKAVNTEKKVIQRSINQKDTLMESTNSLLEQDPSNFGVKTGWTRPAGRCFVGLNERNNIKLIGVVLKADKWQPDYKALMNWAYSTFKYRTVVTTGDTLATVPITGAVQEEIKLTTNRDLKSLCSEEEKNNIKIVTDIAHLEAPLKKGQEVGKAHIYVSEDNSYTIPLVAAEDVGRDYRLLSAIGLGSLLSAGAGIVFTRRRNGR